MRKLHGIVETAIHTEDMERSRAFYEGVLGLEPIYNDNRLSAYAVAGRDVLLVFRKGATAQTVTLPSGTIPGHGGDGALHVAFAIGKDEPDRVNFVTNLLKKYPSPIAPRLLRSKHLWTSCVLAEVTSRR
jgi:catechol 2,3-dioxygenase-like lactoylglutathione lyase family enzyme